MSLRKRAPDARLDALHRLHILDTDNEPPFGRIVRMVADLFGVPNIGIHMLDNERQWVKAFNGQRLLEATTSPAGVGAVKIRLDRMDLVVGATGQTGNSKVLREMIAQRALVVRSPRGRPSMRTHP